jgi:hypothetical protein
VGSWPKGTRRPLRLLPGERLDLIDEVDTTLLKPVWFWDDRLNRPGVYTLQLIAEPNPPSDGNRVYDPLLLNDPDFLKERVISSAATLTIREPEGEDAKVWQAMQEAAPGHIWNAGLFATHGFWLANYVWQNHPTSHYLHEVGTLVSHSDPEQVFRALQAAIDMDPQGPRSDLLRFVLAAYHRRRAEEIALVDGDLGKAVAQANQARTIFQTLMRDTKSATVRADAERGMLVIPDKAALLEQKRLGERGRQKR